MAIEFKDVLDSTDVDVNVTNAVKRQGGLEIGDVTDLQTELDSKLETVPNATDTVVGGIKIRLDSANSTVYITTDGSTP